MRFTFEDARAIVAPYENVVRLQTKPRPVPVPDLVVCPVGPDPESLRAVSRDLTAVGWRFDQAAMHLRAETDVVALLVEPECRGLHVDRALEALALVEAACADFRRLLFPHPSTPGEAA